MSFEFGYTLILFILLTAVLIRNWFKPEIAIFSTLILLIIGNVITVDEAFSGFSNEGMLTIALLFVVAGSIQTTGVMDRLSKIIFGKGPGTIRTKLIRILFPVAFISAFLNNTPIVAMLIPGVKNWSEKNNYTSSKFLIPLSFAAILGGMCTLIGTSTNLIVHGLLIESGSRGFGFFELSIFGIPAAIGGLVYIIVLGYKKLPDRKSPIVEIGAHTREFVIELKVMPNFKHIGKSIEEAELRHLKGLYLFQIERNGTSLNPAKPEDKIYEGDRLFFTGIPKTILELQKSPGLQLIKECSFDLKNYDSDIIKTYEAVISLNSKLAGATVRDSHFRSKYNAVIIAIHRNGERIQKKIGDVALKGGDTLLLLAEKNFKVNWYNSSEFSLISNSAEVHSKPLWHGYLAVGIFIIMLLLSIFNVLSLITAMGIAAVVLILAGSISNSRAINSIDWKILLIIASSFGIAIAMENSGVGIFFADMVIKASINFGTLGVIAGIYLITAVYTNFITNNTAAVLMFPIALSASQTLNMDLHPFAIAIAIGASSSFATPISYQTNLMVYGAGGYNFKDYLKIGMPLQVMIFFIFIGIFSFYY